MVNRNGFIKGKVSKLKEEKDNKNYENPYNRVINQVEEEEDKTTYDRLFRLETIHETDYFAENDDNIFSYFVNIFPIGTTKGTILKEENRKEWMDDAFYESLDQDEIKKIWQTEKNHNKFETLPKALDDSIKLAATQTGLYNTDLIRDLLGKNVFYEKSARDLLKSFKSYFSSENTSFLKFYKKGDNFPYDTMHRFFEYIFGLIFNFDEILLSNTIIDSLFEQIWKEILDVSTDEPRGLPYMIDNHTYMSDFTTFMSNMMYMLCRLSKPLQRYTVRINIDGEPEYIDLDTKWNDLSFEQIRKSLKSGLDIKEYVDLLIQLNTIEQVSRDFSSMLFRLWSYYSYNCHFIIYELRNSVKDHYPKPVDTGIYLSLPVAAIKEYTLENNNRTGEYIERTIDGELLIKANYVDDKLEGNYEEYHITWNGRSMLKIKTTFKNDEKNGEYIKRTIDGELLIKANYVDDELEGPYEEYHGILVDGVNMIKISATYIGGEKNGEYIERGMHGDLEIKANYVDDKLEGIYEEYYGTLNGIDFLKIKATYKNNEKNGEYEEYHTQGELKISTTYKDNEKNGKYLEYYESGIVKIECEYLDDDKEGDYISRYESGIVEMECSYENDEIEGLSINYYETGVLQSEIIYEDGKMEGKYKEFHESGILRLNCLYSSNEKNGYYKEYYESGALKIDCTYKNDEPDGEHRTYYDDVDYQQIKALQTYRMGGLSGKKSTFYKSGNIKKEIEYVENKINGASLEYLDNPNKLNIERIYNEDELVSFIIHRLDGTTYIVK
jgi:antitoxin component YwqK of YwqJK toxin-antitoxin module